MERTYSWSAFLWVGLLPAIAHADTFVTTVFFATGNEARVGLECPLPIAVERDMGPQGERVHMALLDCGRVPTEEAIVAISVLARPRNVPLPTDDQVREFDPESHPGFVAEGVRRVDPELLDRLQRIGESFEGHTIQIYSGYRPGSARTSRHHQGRAFDLTVEGVERERVRDVALGFERTGVGWYPNSVFVHVDVREESHYWVDASAPGEPARYVRDAAPPPPSADEISAMLDGISIPEL